MVALAGCAGGGLSQAEKVSTQGTAFNKALSAGYLRLARAEQAEFDYADAFTHNFLSFSLDVPAARLKMEKAYDGAPRRHRLPLPHTDNHLHSTHAYGQSV